MLGEQRGEGHKGTLGLPLLFLENLGDSRIDRGHLDCESLVSPPHGTCVTVGER